mgnify:CR=1 FL=1
MNSNEFNYIKEVATKQSFSKASKALGISQPALSNYVKKIEDRLGVPLFDRSIWNTPMKCYRQRKNLKI